jgi:hypothetical protein
MREREKRNCLAARSTSKRGKERERKSKHIPCQETLKALPLCKYNNRFVTFSIEKKLALAVDS